MSSTKLSKLLANISHELRTPMHAILSFANLSLKNNKNEKVERFLQNIRTSGIRLTTLLNDLLDLSKLEAGKMQAELIEQDLVTLIENAISEVDSLLDDKNITLEIMSNRSYECMLDQKLFSQVIINLLSNAIKFSPEKDVINILFNELTEKIKEKTRTIIEIRIVDNGPGIPAQLLEHIFERFVQDTDSQYQIQGTGLGLPISREIIELHHGKIWANSPPQGKNSGTEIIIQLPAAHSEDKDG